MVEREMMGNERSGSKEKVSMGKGGMRRGK